jgi:signal transduction histidine kinase/CheY-like chemotaxis protein
MRLPELLDMSVVQRLADANYRANGMPIGIVDAVDGSILVGFGWQDICVRYHRVHPISLERCRASDEHIRSHLSPDQPCEYTCRNGLRDIGLPITAGGEHLATLFLGQFFYEGEAPDRAFFAAQARELGLEEEGYLGALDRVPVFARRVVDNILAYNVALARFLSELADGALHRQRAEARAAWLARFPEDNPDPVLRLGSDLRVVYANHAARERLRELAFEVGQPAPPPLAAAARRASAERKRVQEEFASDGATLSLSFVPIETHVNVYGHDVSDRKRAEQELMVANRRKDEFLGMLSHELRNPLAPIRNALYILDHAEPAGQQARRAREVATRQVAHLTRLVDDLLDVTRIVRGKVELRRADLDLADLTRRTGEDHRALMHEREIDLRVEAPPEPIWVVGDETRLAQVVGNLLHNAAKFTPRGGRVTLSARRVADRAEIRVRDTGAGIGRELMPRIFEPFTQGEQTLARTEGGLGLGLALVKGLVELHRGTVDVTSEGAGLGTEFTIRLPIARPMRRRGGEPAPPTMTGPRQRVLVVDDDRDAAESLADLVEVLGHTAEVALDGPAALQRARAHPPDVVLCDLGLPGMSGYEVARALRTDAALAKLRLVAVSGYAQPEDQEGAAAAGFDAHLPKPLDPQALEELLSRAR